MRKNKFTLEEHIQFGNQIKGAREVILQGVSKVAANYGKNSRQGRLSRRLLKAMDEFKSSMDDKACGENRELPNVTQIYYGLPHPEDLCKPVKK